MSSFVTILITKVCAVRFDEWRARYDTLTFHEHQQINAEWAIQYPHQRSFDTDAVASFLGEHQPGSVVELGGWDGALAAEMLYRFPVVETWVNYDITPNVPQVCADTRYERVVLDDWAWNREARADVLIASHVFEHMRAGQIRLLLDRWDIDSVYVDAPVNGGVWDGYHGSHILELDQAGLVALVESCGFTARSVMPGVIATFSR